MAEEYHFRLPFEVRDYECDLQGIVNNAVYQHYLEHTRHQFLKSSGVTFAQLTKAGVNLIVVRAEIDYKLPLRSGDSFFVGLKMERISLVRFGFLQDIYRVSRGAKRDDKILILRARFTCAAMNKAGKPIRPSVIEPLFARIGIRFK